jgi:SAM-dependent methyltransferase
MGGGCYRKPGGDRPESAAMDRSTLTAYDRDAAAYADDWETQPPPSDMQALIRKYFTPGPTADIGCGSGRDAAWLDANGFPAVGFDASEGLLEEARRRHPGVRFAHAALPALDGLEPVSFTNVLCETVIMHLPAADIPVSVRRLVDILRPSGTLHLSWRVTEGADRRDDAGRLYGAFDPNLVLGALAGTEILLDEQSISASSAKVVRRLIARR